MNAWLALFGCISIINAGVLIRVVWYLIKEPHRRIR